MEEALNIWVDCAMIIMSGFVGAAGLMALMEDRSDVFAVYWALVAATGFIFVGIWTTKALRDGGDE
jgi:hypothetical protein